MPAIRRSLVLCVVAFGVVLSLPAAAQQLTNISTGGTHPYSVAVNPVTNKIYISNNGSANVTVVDGSNNGTSLVSADTGPEGIAVDTATNKIYVADEGANLVTVIDGVTNSTIPVSTGRGPEAIAVDPSTNKIYVANNGGNTVTVIDGSTRDTLTVAVGSLPCAVAINQVTNKIYVANCGSANVTVIDGATNHTITISCGSHPNAIAVNSVTNKIYVTDYDTQAITVINGANDTTASITTGNNPTAVAANQVTNQVFVANAGSNNVTVIDGANNQIITDIGVGRQPADIAIDAVTNQIYVGNTFYETPSISIIDGVSDTVTQTFSLSFNNAATSVAVNPVTNSVYFTDNNGNSFYVISYPDSNSPLQFVPVTPCRLVDTRTSGGPIQGGSFRDFVVPQLGSCNIPSTAAGYSLNVTVVPSGPLGYLTIWPTGEDQPIVSTMNSLDGRIKANAAILQAGYQGAVRVYASNTTNVVLDINGYFAVPGASTLQFYPLPPCRLVDTRLSNGSLGGPFLQGNLERDFPLLESTSCIPQGINPVAYSLNFTAVPHPSGSPLGYLTVWPVGSSKPVVSTLNNPTGTIVANAALVPAGTNGAVAVYPNANTDLLIDIDGYFAAPGSGGLSLYPIAPCRVIDTRKGNGAFRGALNPPVNVTSSPCAPPSTAQAFVFNATVIPSGSLSYLTLWPDGEMQPVVSTLNAVDGAITSNMAIVPTNNDSIDAYAAGLTQLVLDISSYFAP